MSLSLVDDEEPMNCNNNHNTWSGTEGGEDTKPSRRGVVVSMRRKATIMRMAMILGVMVVGTSRTHSSLGGAWAFSPHTVGHLPRSRSRITTPPTTHHGYDHSISRHASSKNSEPSTKNNDRDNNNNKKVGELSSWKNEAEELAKKTSWYAVELFGKVVGSMTNRGAMFKDGDVETPPIDMTRPPSSIQETLQRVQLDNDRAYFLSGQVDEELYALDCVFSDPFVSFQGRERFVTNLANLGSFITKYDAKVLSYNQEDATTIQTKIMVKLELNLPWKPILAWPWGVKYTVDPDTFCIVNHQETWDIDPLEGVKQIFRKPTLRL